MRAGSGAVRAALLAVALAAAGCTTEPDPASRAEPALVPTVWIDPGNPVRVFYRRGHPLAGSAPEGRYVTESEALAEGFRDADAKPDGERNE